MKVTDDLTEWIENRAVAILHSDRAMEKFKGITYKHVEISYGVEGYARDEDLSVRVQIFLEDYLPTDVLLWRVKPQLERSKPHAPEDECFATGKPWGKYVPPRTSIRLRLSIDRLRDGGGNIPEGREFEDIS